MANLLTGVTLSGIGILSYFLAIIIPFVLLLLIARFRGFWASIWFLPAFYGLVAFLLSFEPIAEFFTTNGDFFQGLYEGFYVNSIFFLSFHTPLMTLLSGLFNNEAVTNVLNATWMYFVPYIVLFVIFFLIFKIRRKNKQLIDEF
jgi:hypothetical protein